MTNTRKDIGEKLLLLIGLYLVTILLLALPFIYHLGDEGKMKREQYVRFLTSEKKIEESLMSETPKLDSLSKKILRYNATINASFIDNEIQFGLKDIYATYRGSSNSQDVEILNHSYELYNLLFTNKRELGGNNRDIERLKASLDDCKSTTRQLKESLMRQNAN